MGVNILLLMISVISVKAQTGTESGSDHYGLYSKINSSTAIVIVVLVCAFFFIGLFAIFVRSCTNNSPYDPSSSYPSRNLRGNGHNQGLEKSMIESLFPVLDYAQVKKVNALECAVCLSEFEDGESLRLLPKCGHVFHSLCIDMWFASHVTCPVCRFNLEEVNALTPLPQTTSCQSER